MMLWKRFGDWLFSDVAGWWWEGPIPYELYEMIAERATLAEMDKTSGITPAIRGAIEVGYGSVDWDKIV